MPRIIRRVFAVFLVSLTAVVALPAKDIALYPDEPAAHAGEFVLQDLGGTGPALLFVEDAASRTSCLCEAAKAAAGGSHSYVVWIPGSAGVHEAENFLVRVVNELGAPVVYLAATADTGAPCLAAARDMWGSVARVYDASKDLAARIEPKALAFKVIGYVSGRQTIEARQRAGRYRESGWQGWTVE